MKFLIIYYVAVLFIFIMLVGAVEGVVPWPYIIPPTLAATGLAGMGLIRWLNALRRK